MLINTSMKKRMKVKMNLNMELRIQINNTLKRRKKRKIFRVFMNSTPKDLKKLKKNLVKSIQERIWVIFQQKEVSLFPDLVLMELGNM